MVTPTDPLYGSQWHFPLLGNIQTIWDEYTGDGVSVAVYDDGVQYTHDDLAGNYDSSGHFSFGGTTYDPVPIGSGDGHGTSVAGLIGAVNGNGDGGVGVAWDVSLTGVNLLVQIQGTGSAALIEASFLHAGGFDIMNNSWGITPAYASFQDLDVAGSWADMTFRNFQSISATGRGGLGTIVMQASGNDTTNANGDGTNAHRYTTSIAATDDMGFAASYTNFGSSILVTAPAGAVTTDLAGEDGYNATGTGETQGGNPAPDPLTDIDYTSVFGGTSAATPVTAGVVALMLEANSGLGWRDVQNILAISASHTGSAFGANTGHEVGQWFTNGAGNWNGGGMSFHLSYGFGMVDAFAAVRMAEVWTILFGTAATSANEQTVTESSGTINLAITDFNTINSALTVTTDILVEDITVTVNMQHTWSADVEMFLIAPDGTEYMLMRDEGGGTLMDSGFTWSFGVTGALGMSSLGSWTLRIYDDAGGDSGTLYDWSISFFGSTQTNNDVYHYTEDFLTMLALDASRGTLMDTDGGTDTINLAAISVGVTLDLNGGAVLYGGVNGGSISGSTGIENIIGGDGVDVFTGDGNNNSLYGMRGNDSILGNGGADALFGGAGDDSINGGEGDDRVLGEAGNDTLYGGDGVDTINGGDGDDFIFGGDTAADLRDTIFGGAGHDSIDAGYGNDIVYGQDGNDTIQGGFGTDTLIGQGDDDVITGGALSDEVHGGAGDDFINGGFGHDRLNGGTGADRFYHLGIFDHGSDWIQDYNAAEGDVLLWGGAAATTNDFQVNFANTASAGDAGVTEAFVIYIPTGQIIWALVDGGGQSSINIRLGGADYDLLAP